MNTRTCIAILCIASVASMATGCKKSSNNSPLAAGMSAKVDNTSWTAVVSYAYIDTVYPGPLAGIPLLHIQGYLGDTMNEKNIIIINVGHYVAGTVGTYRLTDTGVANGIFYNTAYSNEQVATTGTLAITKASSGNIQGTFSFTTDSITITQGQFNVNLK